MVAGGMGLVFRRGIMDHVPRRELPGLLSFLPSTSGFHLWYPGVSLGTVSLVLSLNSEGLTALSQLLGFSRVDSNITLVKTMFFLKIKSALSFLKKNPVN